MRGALGQVGFQLQDMVVQLQAGTPALQVFVQQGSQIAGAFGPAGAIIGTVGSLVAIAAGALLGFNREAAASEPILDKVIKSLDDASGAAERYGKALVGATDAQRDFAVAAAGSDLRGLSGRGRAQAGQITQQIIDEFLAVPRSQRTSDYSAVRSTIKDQSAALQAAIVGGKTEDVRRLLNESGLLQSDYGFELADQAVAIAAAIATARSVQSGEAELVARLRQQAAPASNRGSGSVLDYRPGRLTVDGLKAEEEARKDAAEAATKAARESEQQRLKIEKDAAETRKKQRDDELRSILAAYAEDERVGKAVEAAKTKQVEEESRERTRLIEQQAKAQADLLWQPVKDGLREVQSQTTGFFDDLYSGGIKSAQDYYSQVKDLATGTLASISTAALFSPVSKFLAGELGQGSTLGTFAPSLFGGTQVAGASLQGIGISAGLGAAAGGFGGTMLGLDPTGSSLGGALGAGVGFAVGGPAGGVIGGLLGSLGGGALGSVIGGDDNSGDNNANLRFSGRSGRTFGRNTSPDPGNLSIVQTITDQLAALREGLIDMGATVGGGLIGVGAGNNSGLRLTVGGRSQTFDTSDQLSVAALQALITQSTGGLTDQQRLAAANSDARTAPELLADLDVPTMIEQLVTPLSAFEAAMKQLDQTFEKAIGDAERLKLGTEELTKAQKKQRDELIASSLQAANDNAANAVNAARAGFDSLINPLADFRSSLAIGTANPGGLQARLAAARRQFGQATRAARRGEIDADEVSRVIGASQNFLELQRAADPTGRAYDSVFREVTRTVAGIEQRLDSSRAAFERSVPDAVKAAADRQVDELKQIVRLAKDTIAELVDLRGEIASQRRRSA